MKERNISIDILKCLAAILITNSHMELLYGKYNFLATGGAIGDVLFFFCSGFTLFLKPMAGVKYFPDWYKRRINRIYPTIFAVAIMGCIFFNSHRDIIDLIINGGGWFVTCIMLHYIGIYFIGSYSKNKITLITIVVSILTFAWFSFEYNSSNFNIYGDTAIKWLLYFNFVLLGAKLGTITKETKSRPLTDAILLISSIIFFYALYILGMKKSNFSFAQYFSFIPLLSTVYYFYKIGSSDFAKIIYNSKIGNFLIRFIGGLCLEIYLVQYHFINDKMNNIFPLNIFITFLIIIIVAYLVRCVSRFISQTFKDSPYEWKKIVELY